MTLLLHLHLYFCTCHQSIIVCLYLMNLIFFNLKCLLICFSIDNLIENDRRSHCPTKLLEVGWVPIFLLLCQLKFAGCHKIYKLKEESNKIILFKLKEESNKIELNQSLAPLYKPLVDHNPYLAYLINYFLLFNKVVAVR